MLRFTIFLCLFALAFGHLLESREWKLYKKAFRKRYSPSDDKLRHIIYMNNVERINEHNKRFEKSQVSYSLGINQFTDMTKMEIAMLMNGFNGFNSTRLGSAYLFNRNGTVPDTVDWRKKGLVTNVKNQGNCGSCWAFSATGSLEGQHKKMYGKLVSLSEQDLVDCSRDEGNQGCEGGWMDKAFMSIRNHFGIDTEESYPYEGKNDVCRFDIDDVGALSTGFVDLPNGDEDALKHAVATIGPISVAIDANHPDFMFYRSGVLDIEDCSSTVLDHGVLAVGYGTHNGKDYWLVKNSWGESWGMKGYVMMSRNKNNQCGIATKASYPLV